MATTGICNSFKVEMLFGGHCFAATQTGVTVTNTSAQATLTGLASTANLAVGMAVSGTNVAAGAVIASVDSPTQVTMSKVSTGTVTTATFTGDVFKGLLIKAAPSLTYSATQTNVGTPGSGTPSTSNVGTDETTNTSGSGYTSGGVTLGNINPALNGNPVTTASTQFTPNPSWTSSSFSATAFIVYNSSQRLGAAAAPLVGRCVGVYDLGGTNTVSAGTFTILIPTNDGSNGLIRAA